MDEHRTQRNKRETENIQTKSFLKVANVSIFQPVVEEHNPSAIIVRALICSGCDYGSDKGTLRIGGHANV